MSGPLIYKKGLFGGAVGKSPADLDAFAWLRNDQGVTGTNTLTSWTDVIGSRVFNRNGASDAQITGGRLLWVADADRRYRTDEFDSGLIDYRNVTIIAFYEPTKPVEENTTSSDRMAIAHFHTTGSSAAASNLIGEISDWYNLAPDNYYANYFANNQRATTSTYGSGNAQKKKIIIGRYNGTTVYVNLLIDGGDKYSSTFNTTGGTRITNRMGIGDRSAGGQRMYGYIDDVSWYDYVITSDTDLNDLITYLELKYGGSFGRL